MRKVTPANVLTINTIMLKTTEMYINTSVYNGDDLSSISMYTEDVAHNVNALVAFNATQDAQALHDSIMQQDTLVREYYIDVLQYIEQNKLITADNFCCVQYYNDPPNTRVFVLCYNTILKGTKDV